MMDRECRKPLTLAAEEGIATADYEPGHSEMSYACEYRLEVGFSASVQDMEPHPKRVGGR
jgi:hypothetical protein